MVLIKSPQLTSQQLKTGRYLKSSGGDKEVSKESWKDLALQHSGEKATETGVFSGITIPDLLSSQDISPGPGAKIKISGEDGYAVEIPWDKITGSSEYLIADQLDGSDLPKYLVGLFAPDWATPVWPLMHIDPEFPGNDSVGNIDTIEILS